MPAAMLALLQEAHETSAEAAEQAAEPWIVEQVNHIFAPMVLSIERAIMPSIYGLFGGHWHEPAPGETVIPEHIVWAILLIVIAIAGIFLLRGKLSIDRPSKGQQLLEVMVAQISGL